jgi:hypothetical protein
MFHGLGWLARHGEFCQSCVIDYWRLRNRLPDEVDPIAVARRVARVSTQRGILIFTILVVAIWFDCLVTQQGVSVHWLILFVIPVAGTLLIYRCLPTPDATMAHSFLAWLKAVERGFRGSHSLEDLIRLRLSTLQYLAEDYLEMLWVRSREWHRRPHQEGEGNIFSCDLYQAHASLAQAGLVNQNRNIHSDLPVNYGDQ